MRKADAIRWTSRARCRFMATYTVAITGANDGHQHTTLADFNS